MRMRDLLPYVRDTALRLLPHRAPTGLVRIGDPGPESPVLLTGNFTLTVRRLRRVLEGTDAWLLVANSHGINVWCAAGGGHLTQLVLSVDLAGTTPDHPSTVNTRGGTPRICLDPDRCTGAADCVQVCPAEVLRLSGSPPLAVIADEAACIACAACIVQCPEDALFFTYPDGRIVEPATVRSTRLNLLGDRSIEVTGHSV